MDFKQRNELARLSSPVLRDGPTTAPAIQKADLHFHRYVDTNEMITIYCISNRPSCRLLRKSGK